MSHGAVRRTVHAYGIEEIPRKTPSAINGIGIGSGNPEVPAQSSYYVLYGRANAEVEARSSDLILSQRPRAERLDDYLLVQPFTTFSTGHC